MHTARTLAILSALAMPSRVATTQASPLLTVPARTTAAIVDVSVVPMDRARVIEHQTVVVRDGRIAQIGATTSVVIPSGAQHIDGRGKFLMPGLVDMHAHFVPGGETMADPAGRQLALYLGTGFTTVRGLGGAPTALQLRDRISAGELLGPSLVVASPSVNGQSAPTPADATRKVEEAKRAGFDLIKTHGHFASRETYDSMAAAAHRVGLPLVGHVSKEYGLHRAMDANQQIEHLDGVIAAVLKDGAPPPQGDQIIAEPVTLANVDLAKVKALAREMASRHIWNGPTIALFELVVGAETPDALAAREEMRYVPPKSAAQWKAQLSQMVNDAPPDGRRAFIETRRSILRELHAAGAKLLVGSDSPQLFMTPGYGALREIDSFVAAGLTPFAALEAATRNPAEYLGRASEQGTVATGKRADLLLLDANPLDSVQNLRRAAGMFVDGRWIDAARMAALRDAVATGARTAGD